MQSLYSMQFSSSQLGRGWRVLFWLSKSLCVELYYWFDPWDES